MTLIDSLPEDIIIDCISRLPRRFYSTLSLVSKYFQTLITSISHELYARRVLLDRTEHCLYVTISNKSDSNNDGDDHDRLYTLRHNFKSPDNKYSLVPVSSLPRLPPRYSSIVGFTRHTTSQECQAISDRPALSIYKYTSVGEIHIRGCKLGSRGNISDGVVMLLKSPHKSVSNEIPDQTLVGLCQWVYNSAMRLNYIYIVPKSWYDNDCFLDGVSYFYDPPSRMLRGFDMKQRCLKRVKGVELMSGEDVKLSRTVVYGEKVVLFLQKEIGEKKEIWCAEIKVEKDQEGGLCGRVEWCGCVLEGQWLTLKNSLAVKV